MSVSIDIRSETAPLSLIVTSRPGPEFEAMVPENLERYRPGPDHQPVTNPDYLLFDDLVLLSALQREHDQLTSILKAVTGHEGHVDFRWLLASALSAQDAREEVIGATIALERELYAASDTEARRIRDALEALDATRLAEALITGRAPHTANSLLKWPAPNVLFARDLIVAMGDALVLTHAAEPGRRRDMTLMRAVARHHSLFADIPLIDLADEGPIRDASGPIATVEGGDVQVLSSKVVLIGVGLRTTMSAVERLAPKLFERGIEVVIACEMPRRRAAMHIDTLFTRIDDHRCLIYPPLVTDPEGQGIRIHRLTPKGTREVGRDLLAALKHEGIPLEPVFCGGKDPVAQAREQWSDGANAFALAPGVIICYGRNERTLRELNRAGYEIMSPERFIPNAMSYVDDESRHVAITLEGHELVRGRGGPRCLTMPLRRMHSVS